MSEKPVRVGQRVELPSKETFGTVAFVGSTNFSQGKWIGVILDEKKGKNNGTVQGKSYFQCEEGFGTFMRQSQLVILDDDNDDASSDTTKSSIPSAGTTPTTERPKSRLPLGPVGKTGATPRTGKDEKSPGKESPRVEGKKASSFVETNFIETLTTQFTPGPASAAMQTLGEKASAMQAQKEMENLKAEITDLNEKLETLKIKRAQDKEKLKEGEKVRLQVEALMEFKSRIMESQGSLQKDLQKAREEAKAAVEAKDKFVEESEELMESVEMLTLDKEMAEEKAEALQMEMDQLKEKVEELTLDLEILRAESGEGEEGLLTIEGKSSTVQVKQLEQQNARLRETLVRIRDISAHDKHELQKLQKELEGKKSEVLELSKSKEKFASQVAEKEAIIADLQEQVDAALGAEEMCEMLTDRNLNLEERVAELLESVNDLEAINDMNDQLQENSRELELELREELDMANAKTRQFMKDMETTNALLVDRDTTIKKFRDLVQKQQDQNRDLQHALEKETNKPYATPSEIIDFKKIFTETKAQGKAIDLELRRLEVKQANQHVTYLTQYLPDKFMSRGGDHDAVLMLLLFARLIWKADIVTGGIQETCSLPEVIDRNAVLKSHAVDQFSFSARMNHMLYMLQAILRQYQHVLNTCSVDLFLKIGTFYPEIAAHERNLDFYIDLLRKDQLDETVLTEPLEKIVTYFQTAYPTHLAEQKLDQTAYLNDVSKALNSASQALKTEACRIEALLPPSASKNSETSDLMRYITTSSNDIGNFAKRIRRRLPQDGSTGPVSYPLRTQESLTFSMCSMYNASRALRHVAKMCMQQTTLIGDTEGGIGSDKVKELIHQATDLIYGSEDQGPESLKVSLNLTYETVAGIADTIEKGEYDFDGTPDKQTIQPMALRAESIKRELDDTEYLKYKLETKEQDIKELKLAAKQKNEELSEMTVRRDMAEKKISTTMRDSDLAIEKLQRKLEDTLLCLRRKEKEYEETLDQLQLDNESITSEKEELRSKLRSVKLNTLAEFTKATSGPGSITPTIPSMTHTLTPSNDGTVVKDSPLLLQQIADLKVALNKATEAKYVAVAADMHRKLASLRPLKVSHRSLPSSGDEKRDLDKDERAEELASKESMQRLNELCKLTSQLRKELDDLIIGVKVVDITKRKAGMEPATQSCAPINHLINYNYRVETMKNRLTALQDETAKLVADMKPGGCVKTSFTSFPTPQLVKAVAEKQLIKIGRITVPGDSTKSSETIPVILGPEDLRNLHMSLIN